MHVRVFGNLPTVAIMAFSMWASDAAFGQQLSGIVTDEAGAPVAAATVKLDKSGQTTVSGPDGKFTLSGSSAISNGIPRKTIFAIHEGSMVISSPERSKFSIEAYSAQGKSLASIQRDFDAGTHVLKLPISGAGIGYYKIQSNGEESMVNLAKQAQTPAALYDVIVATKAGYLKSYLDISTSVSSTLKIKMLKEGGPHFSFFVTSIQAMQELSGNQKGFGGDFQFGETGPGSGLRGADKICAAVAERVVPGSSFKGWRAFLSATAGVDGKQVNAIDRVGEGPWYDRKERVVAMTKADLTSSRPKGANSVIINDLPNENGFPNGYPTGGSTRVDNHHTLTGSKSDGTIYKVGSKVETCQDWTSKVGSGGKPRYGVSWPRDTGDGWINMATEGGCAPGINLVEGAGATEGNTAVGSNGGYGGIYCFALNP